MPKASPLTKIQAIERYTDAANIELVGEDFAEATVAAERFPASAEFWYPTRDTFGVGFARGKRTPAVLETDL